MNIPFRLPWTSEEIAQRLHDAYVVFAPEFGGKASAASWYEVPEQNRALMIAVVRNVFIEQLSAELAIESAAIQGEAA